MSYNHWLLPEGVQEVLPVQAKYIETLRRQILDHFATWAYQLVDPPVVDFLSSLLTGSGHDLERVTATIPDSSSGRLLGIRADMTPQVARIDAHHYEDDLPRRFCYTGRVVRTRIKDFQDSRTPLQVGLELYGDDSAESDVEVLSLLLDTLQIIGFDSLHLDLGQVDIYRTLASSAKLNAEQESLLFDILQRKAVTEIKEILETWQLSEQYRTLFLHLVHLHGDDSVLEQAKALFRDEEKVLQAITKLETVSSALQENYPSLKVYYDLSELRGYRYHTGLVFAVYIGGQGQCIAQGGRYNGIGKMFGCSRPATGFSLDLAFLAGLKPPPENTEKIIYAPAINDLALKEKIQNLRQQGVCVVQALSKNPGSAKAMRCSHILDQIDGIWQVTENKD